MTCESDSGKKCASRVVGAVDSAKRSVSDVVTNETFEGQAVIAEFLEEAFSGPQKEIIAPICFRPISSVSFKPPIK